MINDLLMDILLYFTLFNEDTVCYFSHYTYKIVYINNEMSK